jgi:heme exporter protein CcmD
MTQGVVARPDLWANFIWPAYALTLVGLVGLLLWAYISMRNAERRAEESKRP